MGSYSRTLTAALRPHLKRMNHGGMSENPVPGGLRTPEARERSGWHKNNGTNAEAATLGFLRLNLHMKQMTLECWMDVITRALRLGMTQKFQAGRTLDLAYVEAGKMNRFVLSKDVRIIREAHPEATHNDRTLEGRGTADEMPAVSSHRPRW